MVETTPNALTQRYTYIELVGAGAAGKTYKAYDKLTGEHVAIKALRGQVDFKTRELFEREVETLKSIDVKGVPKFIDFVESPDDSGSLSRARIRRWRIAECVTRRRQIKGRGVK